jgi:hypothetical protein
MSKQFHVLQRDAASRALAISFVQALVDTGRVARNERGVIVWQIGPNDWCPIARKEELQNVLETGELLTITGDTHVPDTWFVLWCAVNDRRFMLPRINARKPYVPLVPEPVRHLPAGDRYVRPKDTGGAR